MIRLIAVLGLTVCLVAGATSARADYREVSDAYEKGDYEAVFRGLREAAEQADDREPFFFGFPAQIALGWMHMEGLGVERDYKEAAKWLRKVAERMDALIQEASSEEVEAAFSDEAAFNDDAPIGRAMFGAIAHALAGLGWMHMEGLGVERDYGEAAKLYRKAIERGGDFRFAELREAVERGDVSLPELRELAERGDTFAQIALGLMHLEGLGVERNYEEAARWGRKSAEQGKAGIQVALAWHLARPVGGAELDARKVMKLLREVAERECTYVQALLGLMHMEGFGVELDYEKAAKWYRKAAERGNLIAQVRLGRMYMRDLIVLRDDDEPDKWYRKAAEAGDVDAQFMLGALYWGREGRLFSYDKEKGAKWLRKAAEQGRVDAQFLLGISGALDDEEAAKWLRKAAEQGDADSQYHLGRKYFWGLGVERDFVLGHMWFNIAAASGHEEAEEAKDSRYQHVEDEELIAKQLAEAQRLADECIARDLEDC